MRFLRKIMIICFALVANQQVIAQANPGYLGKKNLIQLDINGLMGNMLFDGPLLNTNFGFSYEIARREDFAWNFGYANTSQEMDKSMMEGEGLTFVQDDGQSTEIFDLNGGSMNYSISEFKVSPKWYALNKGGIAPYGSSGSLEFSLGFISVDPQKVDWRQAMNEQNSKINNFPTSSIFSISYFFGGRRMIADQIGLEYNFGFGYTFYQSLDGNLLDLVEEGGQFQDLAKYYQYVAVKHASSSKLFQAKVGICYLF